jgi:hypothetical protein
MNLVQAIFTPDVTAALLAAFGPAALIYAPTRRLRRLLADIEMAPAGDAEGTGQDVLADGAGSRAA